MNKLLELKSKYCAKLQRNKYIIETLEEKLQKAEDYERLRLYSEQVRLSAINLELHDFIRDLELLGRSYEGSNQDVR